MHRILTTVSFLVFLLVLLPSSINAQTTTNTNTSADSPAKVKQQVQELREQRKTAVSQIKETAQMKREKTNAMIKTKRDEFKTKLQTIRDQRKKALIETIDVKLSNINTKHTDRFTKVLSNLQALLDKISTTTTDAKILVDIKAAQTAIDVGKAAVELQAGRTYTIHITNENALRLNVGTTNSQLRQDLMATHKLVVVAKQTVQKLRENSAMMKKEATSSANL